MQSYFHFSAIPLTPFWTKGDYEMQEAIPISLVVTNNIKEVLQSAKQMLCYTEPTTRNVLKPDMTKIIP